MLNEIYERIKYSIIGRDKLPPPVRRILETYGDMKIRKIEIARVPLQKQITYVGNLITLGKLNKIQKDMGYDKLFHLYSIITLENNDEYILEKNEVINLQKINIDPRQVEETEVININLKNKQLTLNSILSNIEKAMGQNKFLTYNVKDNNCQYFMIYLLKSNGLGTEQDYKFIQQNIIELIHNLGGIYHNLATAITKLGERFNILLYGRGKRRYKYKL